MKQKLLFACFSFIVLLSGCKKENKIWDIYPVVVSVSVMDAAGNDLLNPQTPGCLDASKIKAIYKGQEYGCKDPSQVKTKAYMPRFYGLELCKYNYSEIFLLNFGEFDGARDYIDEVVTLVWEDGSSDKIRFNRDYKWKRKGPEVKEEWFLNDTPVSSGIIRIIK